MTVTLPQIVNSNQLFPDNLIDGNQDSIFYWLNRYGQTKVVGSPEGTIRAKKSDLQLFTNFFVAIVGTDVVDFWTPSVSKSFKSWLQTDSPVKPERAFQKPYAPTSINRMLATLRHFAGFIADQRPFIAGNPFDGVRDLVVSTPDWKGVDDVSLMRIRAALDQVTQLSSRRHQMPLRNRAVFTLALDSGLRSFEITSLNFDQYQGKYLKDVRGKGDQYADVYLSTSVRQELDAYIAEERGINPGPLFITNRGGRICRQQIYRFLQLVANQANARISENEKIHLSAHMLRHTSVKKVHDQKGAVIAKKFSRHRSFAQLERYASQTKQEHEEMVEKLWD